MNYTAERIDRYLREGRLQELVTFAEERHILQFEMLLREIRAAYAGMAQAKATGAVLVTGPSSSGKTTCTGRLASLLAQEGYHCTVISLDDYYLNRAEIIRRQLEAGHQPQNENDFDFESPDAFDLAFFRRQMAAFLCGEEITLPHYNFNTGRRESSARRIRIEGRDMILVEGIQALNPTLLGDLHFDHVFRVYICPFDSYIAPDPASPDGVCTLLPQQVRFMRRAVRDRAHRSASLRTTVEMWPGVRAGEEKHIKPVKKYADFFFNSSLEYEIVWLRAQLEQMLAQTDAETRARLETIVRTDALRAFPAAPRPDIPENSLFCEFF